MERPSGYDENGKYTALEVATESGSETDFFRLLVWFEPKTISKLIDANFVSRKRIQRRFDFRVVRVEIGGRTDGVLFSVRR